MHILHRDLEADPPLGEENPTSHDKRLKSEGIG
jgi:hypothetical protein